MNPNELAAYMDGTLCQEEDGDYVGAELCAYLSELRQADFPRDRCFLTEDESKILNS